MLASLQAQIQRHQPERTVGTAKPKSSSALRSGKFHRLKKANDQDEIFQDIHRLSVLPPDQCQNPENIMWRLDSGDLFLLIGSHEQDESLFVRELLIEGGYEKSEGKSPSVHHIALMFRERYMSIRMALGNRLGRSMW